MQNQNSVKRPLASQKFFGVVIACVVITVIAWGGLKKDTEVEQQQINAQGSVLIDDEETQKMREEFAAEQQLAFTTDAVQEGIVEIHLSADEADIYIGEEYPVEAWLYNGELPGQEYRITLGQTVRVTLENNLDEATTIHWHGVRVPNQMDGVPDITQEPVEPGETFVYEFTPKDPGTYWFHPHYNTSEQIERGLYGALIVEDQFRESFTKDETWVLDDWLIRDGGFYEYFNTRHDLAHDGRWGNLITINGETEKTTTWNPGDRVRLRLVNAANGRIFLPDFGELPVEVIAYDGIQTFGSVGLSEIELSPGNRIDLMITVPEEMANQEVQVTDVFTRYTNQLATISIGGGSVETPKLEWDITSAVAWNNVEFMEADHQLVFDAVSGGEYGIQWRINGEAHPDTESVHTDHESFVIVDLVNESGRLHPMHLHGQFFRVLGRDGVYDQELFWRDTVLVMPRETVRIAFSPMDVGEWAWHCHILEHAAAGMMTSLKVE
jgi:FtsP/CotA-like multicopper oxidase with cupredoxin domain